MRFQEIAVSAFLLSATASAFQLHERYVGEEASLLFKRQQFTPTTTTAEGATCADTFGPGYTTCREASSSINRLCYNPSLGQTCCQSSWACPSDSFCSTAIGACCPNGQDPAVCAAQNSGSKPSGSLSPAGSNSTAHTSVAAPKPTSSKAATGDAPRRQASSVLGLVGVIAGAMALL